MTDEDIDEIVEKCLDNNPSNRYQNIQSIKEIIANYNAKTREKIVDTAKDDIQVNTEEIKEKLIDILDNICGKDKSSKKFEITEKDTIEFLDNLNINLDKLQFFDTVPMSKFLGINSYNSEPIDKKYFIELEKLYKEIKTTYIELLPSFIEYIKVSINDNYYELPF